MKNVFFSGVGGQGIIFCAKILAAAAQAAGYDVTTSEIHGMAQRGGSVTAQVRYGQKVLTPSILEGEADALLAMEQVEALRYAHFLKSTGTAVVSTQNIIPVTVSSGQATYPQLSLEELKTFFPHLIAFDATEKAQALNNIRAANTLMLGALSTALDLPVDAWILALKKCAKPSLLDSNIEVFQAGRSLASQTQIIIDAPLVESEKILLSGNEAIARAAYEVGVKVAAGYPGTPSTEILENMVKYKDVLHCEWAPNEKVAYEVALGAALTGVRALVTMKHVGLNVAADPLLTSSYVGVKGGLVVIVADDFGQHSSQTEQDTRHYARLAKVPIFEPANPTEAKDFLRAAFERSEKDGCPVIFRTTTAVAHSRSLVNLSERCEPAVAHFEKDPSHYVLVPNYAKVRRVKVEERLAQQKLDASKDFALNVVKKGTTRYGIISSGTVSKIAEEFFPDAPFLKLGWSFPFPDDLIKHFAKSLDTILVIEEGDDFLEEHIKSLGIKCLGKEIVPRFGELVPREVLKIKNQFLQEANLFGTPMKNLPQLPARPPVLCPSCPHRGIFYALSKFDVVVVGDIGCYSLGTFPPLSRMDTLVCMGAGVSMPHGMEKAGDTQPMVGILGDSTFYHSGITGLIDIVYNKGTSTIIVVDNRITAMTGHQEHPGSGQTLMGEETHHFSIEAMAKACGVKRIRTVNPYELEKVIAVLKEEIATPEPSLIISQAPCPLAIRKAVDVSRMIIVDDCKNCRKCLKLGCPAIESTQKAKPQINPLICGGCSLCEQACSFSAIKKI